MAGLIREGKILHWGISETTEEYLRRAHAVCPVTAVQNRYSMMARWHEALFPVLEELGVGFVAFSPLANGLLTDCYTADSTFDPATDYRASMPQFRRESFERNRTLFELVEGLAEEHRATPSQIALAWMMNKRPWIVPIPGTRHLCRLKGEYRGCRHPSDRRTGAGRRRCPRGDADERSVRRIARKGMNTPFRNGNPAAFGPRRQAVEIPLKKRQKLAVVSATAAGLLRIYCYFACERPNGQDGLSERYNRYRQIGRRADGFRGGIPGPSALPGRHVPLPLQRTGFRAARRRSVDHPQAETDRENRTVGRFPVQDHLCETRFHRFVHAAEQLRHERLAGAVSQPRDAPHARAADRLPPRFRPLEQRIADTEHRFLPRDARQRHAGGHSRFFDFHARILRRE